MVASALPEKYISDRLLNEAFANHVRAHYMPGISMWESASPSHIKSWVKRTLAIMPPEVYDELTQEIVELSYLRNMAGAHMDVVMSSISAQTGKKHRKLETGLSTLKPKQASAAYADVISKTMKLEDESIPEMNF